MITEEKKREYLQIAVLIDAGAIPVPLILVDFEEHQERAAEMVNFWLTYDEFTQKIVHYLAIEKLRIHFENCYRKEYKCSIMTYLFTILPKKIKLWVTHKNRKINI